MAYSEAQKRASRKYNETAYDRLNIYIKKGMKDKIKATAEAQGKSVNEFVRNLIEENID
jgi:predicted HicB family RNase H-like nuclease